MITRRFSEHRARRGELSDTLISLAISGQPRRRAGEYGIEKIGNAYIVTQDGAEVEPPKRHASWDEARARAAELRRGIK